ncbi:hypothetical protein J6590_015115 [Homalodisca vitripennis]|nr:hypothetical protein J6590_015115 [Homalodisca vitripennis]
MPTCRRSVAGVPIWEPLRRDDIYEQITGPENNKWAFGLTGLSFLVTTLGFAFATIDCCSRRVRAVTQEVGLADFPMRFKDGMQICEIVTLRMMLSSTLALQQSDKGHPTISLPAAESSKGIRLLAGPNNRRIVRVRLSLAGRGDHSDPAGLRAFPYPSFRLDVAVNVKDGQNVVVAVKGSLGGHSLSVDSGSIDGPARNGSESTASTPAI